MSALVHERIGEPQKMYNNLQGTREKNKVWDYNRSRGSRSIWDEIRQTPPLLSDRRAWSGLRVSPISYLRAALFIPSMRSPYMLFVSVFIFKQDPFDLNEAYGPTAICMRVFYFRPSYFHRAEQLKES